MSGLIHRAWAMPSANTFSIAPIYELLRRHMVGCAVIVDPFARNSRITTVRNDLNPNTSAEHHEDAIVFLGGQPTGCADAVLFDPPYSPRQIAEAYQSIGRSVGMSDTQNAALYAQARAELHRILRPGGVAITCGWNSTGMGKMLGYERIETLLVCHSGAHNDTIVVVERKLIMEPSMFECKGACECLTN